MGSSPFTSEYPSAADALAVPILHPPRCSVCGSPTKFIFKGEYNCLGELNSDLEVLESDYYEFFSVLERMRSQYLMSEDHHIDIESLEPVDEGEVMRERKKKTILDFFLYTARGPDSFIKGNEIVLGITGQAAFSLMGYALTGTGSSSSPALYFVVGATAIGFICTWISLTLTRPKKRPARILGKVGAIAAASAVIVAMGTVLPGKTIWISGIACLLTGVAMALA